MDEILYEKIKQIITDSLKPVIEKLNDIQNQNIKDHDNFYDTREEVISLKKTVDFQQDKINNLWRWLIGSYAFITATAIGALISILIVK